MKNLISSIYGSIMSCRTKAYTYGLLPSYSYAVPIVSIGNIQMGGTGKTPFVIWLCQRAIQKGKIPLILSRGHKGKAEHGSFFLSFEQNKAFASTELGDECLLYYKYLSKGGIALGKNRQWNLEQYYSVACPDFVVLEDGFQHQRLKRDLDLVLLDASAPLSSLYPFPRGMLRGNFSEIERAHGVILTKTKELSQVKKKYLYSQFSCPVMEADFEITAFHSLASRGEGEKKQIKVSYPSRWIAICGIGNPRYFVTSLQDYLVKNGGELVDSHFYPDHYSYTAEDISKLEAMAQEQSCGLIMTEKDAVKWRGISVFPQVFWANFEMSFAPDQEEILLSLLHEVDLFL